MNKKEVMERINREANEIEIPESIQPDHMRTRIEEHMKGKSEKERVGRKEWERKRLLIYPHLKKSLIAAACLAVLLGGTLFLGQAQNSRSDSVADTAGDIVASIEEIEFPQVTYEEIYAAMMPAWEQDYAYLLRSSGTAGGSGNTAVPVPSAEDGVTEVVEAQPASETAADTGGSSDGYSILNDSSSVGVRDLQNSYAETEKQVTAEGAGHGTTNIQTVGVDEGDIIKNDGRYLYQIVRQYIDRGLEQTIQIVDTLDGLERVGLISGFESIEEFYVRDDRLVVIENKYHMSTTEIYEVERAMHDIYDNDNAFHEIYFYDISDRSRPHLLKYFTLEGSYTSSRIADGYFYGFSRFYARPGGGQEDYDAYIPSVDGKRIEAGDILLPEESKGTSYLVLVSVDLNNPKEFIQTKAVVSTGDLYYVSGENIYITSSQGMQEKTGWTSNLTKILRFSYEDGRFALEAEGNIKGQLESSFSLDEYDGNLRAVTTVRDYYYRKLIDDRTGEHIGYEVLQDKESNSLYVLDESLQVIGSIEGLAEDERVYSARFFGETGYFVTFRQVDPLYAVDLSNPEKPQILSELKISGFSEYLHIYGTDRLLGIGMEADEETGQQEGMKLSMFDISDPTNVQEVAKMNLKDYDYSEALYNHKAVLISPAANIFGFEAEGYGSEYVKNYLVFSYKNEEDIFVRRMELDTKDEQGDYREARGTFIGEVFYLLLEDGNIRAYDRNSGEKTDSLESLSFMQ